MTRTALTATFSIAHAPGRDHRALRRVMHGVITRGTVPDAFLAADLQLERIEFFKTEHDGELEPWTPETAPHARAIDVGPPWMRQVCEALGWQGGTWTQVIAEVQRLRAATAGQASPTEDVDSLRLLEQLTAFAEHHGDESGSEYEAGDLADLLSRAWALLPPARRREVYASFRAAQGDPDELDPL